MLKSYSVIAFVLVLASSLFQFVSASEMDDISAKCGLAETAQNAGKLDEAEKNLIDALQISWKIPLASGKPLTAADKAKIAAMTQDEKMAVANKEYTDSLSDVTLLSIPMALGQLCDSFDKAGRYDKVIEIHEWLVKNDSHRGGDNSEFDIALNQILMAKAALQAKDKVKSSAYYACAIADEMSMKKKLNAGQLQGISGALKDYSDTLRTSGAADEADTVMRKSQEYLVLATPAGSSVKP